MPDSQEFVDSGKKKKYTSNFGKTGRGKKRSRERPGNKEQFRVGKSKKNGNR